MEDELEDKIIYQSFISHMKLLSKFAVGLPLNSNHFGYVWRLLRINFLKPEVFLCSVLIFIIIFYIQAVNIWSRSLIGRLSFNINRVSPSKGQKLKYAANLCSNDNRKLCIEIFKGNAAAFGMQGRRPKMEDRVVVIGNLSSQEAAIYAIFDGHGGEFAANYAQDHLIENLNLKVVKLRHMRKNGLPSLSAYVPALNIPPSPKPEPKAPESAEVVRRKSIKKAVSTSVTDDCFEKYSEDGITDPQLIEKLCRGITRKVRPSAADNETVVEAPEITSYINTEGVINYGRLLTDEVLSLDRSLVAAAKKTMNVAGTTALIAVLDGSQLIVANVGDSRGVMCDHKGNVIPLSFDHKPQLMREKKRIKEAGGFISFNGVWRVAGILATSRALGDYPLKNKKWVIANPDILTFDMLDHKPQFLILASDGLWDIFTNEEAVAFIKDRLEEPDFGAKSIMLEAYNRGSLDNISVIVIRLRNHVWPNNSS